MPKWNIELEIVQTYRVSTECDSEEDAIQYALDCQRDGNLEPMTEDVWVEAWEIEST